MDVQYQRRKIRGNDVAYGYFVATGEKGGCSENPNFGGTDERIPQTGDIYVYTTRAINEQPQVWVYGVEGAWKEAVEGETHPGLAKYNLHQDKGKAGWVQGKSLKTYGYRAKLRKHKS